MNKFTQQQQKAILTRGSNVIVSAGAGSGKTAVLTERVFRLIVDEHIPLNRLLVLTFTNAAAHEMKVRIKNRLAKEQATKRFADEIENAQITTFDAYAYYLVRKYHYLLKIDADVSIIEENLISVTKQHYLDEILQAYYQEKEPRWVELITNYTIKNDSAIRKLILSFDRLIDLKNDEKDYIKHYLTNHFSEQFFAQSYENFLLICKDFISNIQKYLRQIDNAKEATNLNQFFERYLAAADINLVLNTLRNFDAKFPRKVNKLSEEDKNLHDAISKDFKELKKYADLGSYDDLQKRYFSTKNVVSVIVEILEKLRTKMDEYKHKYNVYTFNNIAKMALSLLDYEQVQNEIRSQMQYIMIDEYQDTSDLQEAFLAKIANNNLYMVGDIKQSIYRFRHANSDIFRDKYLSYQDGTNGKCIDMNENFRSRSEVINDINSLFSQLMSVEYGGADYRATHQIIFANKAYTTNGQVANNCSIDALTYNAISDDDDDNLSRQQKEGIIISDKISQLISSKYLVFPKDAKAPRPIEYQDIAILVDRKTNFDIYQKALQARQIPVKIHQERTVTTAHVTQVLRSLIKLAVAIDEDSLDSKQARHSFLSIARSYLYQLPDDETYQTLAQEKDFFNHPIILKMHNFCKSTRDLPLKKRIEQIIFDFDLAAKLPLIGEIQANLYLLNSLVDAATTLEKLDYSLKDFSEYFESITDFDLDFSIPDYLAPQNAVQLMSIHKSKGLEFPLVFYCGLASRFNVADLRTAFFADNHYGIQLPNIDESGGTSMFRYLVNRKEIQADISEKIRLFYVALTRAREKIFLVLPLPKDGYQKPISQASCLADFVYNWDLFPERINLIEQVSATLESQQNILTIPANKEKIAIGKFNFVYKEKPVTVFSKTITTDSDPNVLRYGEELHYLLSLVNFETKNIDFIVDDKQKNIVQKIINLDLFTDVKANQVYQEYSFYDEEFNRTGIIDGFIVFADYITLFDYKLANINDISYDQQVTKYAKYLACTFNKPIRAYLISILNAEYRSVALPSQIA
ncbi:MAG: UvrD-helicase domain-containing protein [Bacilli bacterium]|jgi:ATP-dependent helicase/nuclease subunit A|nr:UvrD-helicase domain-containing protein [Bacilli bacterium]MDD3388724.1 UvrD-helicase domain-containing protein [Bacilli bacterium]MDD4344514.1 UvrD-helicase domain-containing protein [Bacilli bacterium]MDY0399177.1 UvrD-helicase domain-containing protein [Bacilli bacterium]